MKQTLGTVSEKPLFWSTAYPHQAKAASPCDCRTILPCPT
ncbi:hypothetical protein HMPREF0758_3851 [Serratia odorifera DSM 4582]|uniref:Uncharacterized protein n=1 Tax=Serratia odorifera DSM 4582 TaxID=667129 RepID=D4E6Q1_SEROD|nr:hypothetical protein HMPREF0758_3851 [Serratia odorifera DSM 4582]